MVNTDHIGCQGFGGKSRGYVTSTGAPQAVAQGNDGLCILLFIQVPAHSKNRERDCSTVASAAVNSNHGNDPHMIVDYCNELPPNERTS